MLTIYSYPELSYKVQQKVKERIKQTTSYKNYYLEAKQDYKKEVINEYLTDFTMNSEGQLTISMHALADCVNGINIIPNIQSVTLLFNAKDVLFIIDAELTIEDFSYLTEQTKQVKDKVVKLINNINNRVQDWEPDFEQYIQDNWFTEDGYLVTIEE